MKKKNRGIDWLNHAISFLSALIGIFIAFQLEDYKDSRRENEELKVTLAAVKSEIENNMAIYQSNIDSLSGWLEYYAVCKTVNDKGEIRVSRSVFDKMKSIAPKRFTTWTLKHIENDTMMIYNTGDASFVIDVDPKMSVSTSSWQAGLYSGALNRVDHDRLTKLNQIYDWTSKDIGLNEKDFYSNILSKDLKISHHYKFL